MQFGSLPESMNQEQFSSLIKDDAKSKLEENFYAAVRNVGMPLPQRQHKFHPTRRFRLDFAWIDCKVAVEINGGTYTDVSRHNFGPAMHSEYDKHNLAVAYGWALLVFDSVHVSKHIEECLSIVGLVIQQRSKPGESTVRTNRRRNIRQANQRDTKELDSRRLAKTGTHRST